MVYPRALECPWVSLTMLIIFSFGTLCSSASAKLAADTWDSSSDSDSDEVPVAVCKRKAIPGTPTGDDGDAPPAKRAKVTPTSPRKKTDRALQARPAINAVPVLGTLAP